MCRHVRLGGLIALLLLSMACSPCSSFYVCLIQSQNFADCDLSTIGAGGVSTGYDVDYWRSISKELGWLEGVDVDYGSAPAASGHWSFSCQPPNWNAMMGVLSNTSQYSQCAVALGSISTTTARIDQGVQFSERTRRAGVGTLVRNDVTNSVSAWGFLHPFTRTLWIAFAMTLLFLPVVFWFVESVHADGYVLIAWGTFPELQNAIFKTLLTLFNAETFAATKFCTQLMVLSFCVVSLTVVTNYIANLAAGLTLDSATPTLAQVAQLQGQRVAAHDIYVKSVETVYGISGVRPIPWVGESTFLQVAGMLRSGELQAYMVDWVALSTLLNVDNPDCGLRLLSEVILPIDTSFAFHHLFPSDLISLINQQVEAATEVAFPAVLEARYFGFLDHCGAEADRLGGGVAAITFVQLRGLWIILGAVVAFVAVWTCWTLLSHVGHHMDVLHLQEPHKPSPRPMPPHADPAAPPAKRSGVASLTSSLHALKPSASRVRYTSHITRKAFGRVFVRHPRRQASSGLEEVDPNELRRGSSPKVNYSVQDNMPMFDALNKRKEGRDEERKALTVALSGGSQHSLAGSDRGARSDSEDGVMARLGRPPRVLGRSGERGRSKEPGSSSRGGGAVTPRSAAALGRPRETSSSGNGGGGSGTTSPRIAGSSPRRAQGSPVLPSSRLQPGRLEASSGTTAALVGLEGSLQENGGRQEGERVVEGGAALVAVLMAEDASSPGTK